MLDLFQDRFAAPTKWFRRVAETIISCFGKCRLASVRFPGRRILTLARPTDQTRAGWTVGGGGEWMIAPKWSIKAEYLYVDLGKVSYTQACTKAGICTAPPLATPASYQTDLHVHEHIARVGVNYHFDLARN